MNFWLKTVSSEKITRDKVARNALPLNMDNSIDVLRGMCHELDLPSPVFTKYHFENLEKFNFVKFRPADFVDAVDFDYMSVENFYDK